MEAYSVILVTGVLVGSICAPVAKRKGKDPLLWFVVCALLNVFALGILVPLKKKHGGENA